MMNTYVMESAMSDFAGLCGSYQLHRTAVKYATFCTGIEMCVYIGKRSAIYQLHGATGWCNVKESCPSRI